MRNVLIGLACLALLLPVVEAHGAAAPRPQETRLLHDHNDDCGGDGVTTNCRGTLDLIALDVQELYDGGDKVNFRITFDTGQSGSHKLTLTFDSPSGKKTFETTTTDQAKFTGGFDKLTVSSTGDGTRLWLDATTTSEKAGLSGGGKISNFRLEARRDNTLGDFMPGGYQGPLGPVQDPSQGDGPTNYVKPDYQGRGASYYVFVTGANAIGSGGKATASFAVQNQLDVAQTVTLTVSADGADVSFGGPATKVVDVARKGSANVEVDVDGEGQGQFTITATTNLGGRTVRTGSYSIEAESAPGTDDPSSDPVTVTDEPDKGAPMIPLAMTALAILIAASRRR